jgi:hypothetical protein
MHMDHEYPVQLPPEPVVVEPTKKGWLHHPYIFTGAAVLAILAIVALIVTARSGVGGAQDATNWVGASMIFQGGRSATEAERLRAEEAAQQQQGDAELGYIPIATSATVEEEDFGADLTKLLALLAQPPATSTLTGETPAAFAYIPQGLISISSGIKVRTASQEALFTYGNEAGGRIQSFESMHGNMPQILKDQAEDRDNAEKKARVKQLGFDIAALGRELLDMQDVPQAVKTAHENYATSYRIVGTNLTKVADTSGDEAFLAAIETYNTSVEAHSQRFGVLVSVFNANDVAFSPSNPGSTFMFNAQLSL